MTSLQAPIQCRSVSSPIKHPSTFAHVLHNSGFGDFAVLEVAAEAWRNIFRYVQPDMAVFDHSPTALLASLSFDVKRMVIGTGFCCPADVSSMPDWRPWLSSDPLRLHDDELGVLKNVNRQLAAWNVPTLQHLGDLYTTADLTALATVPELDHFGPRDENYYFGVWNHRGGQKPKWPTGGTGKRVYVYVRPFAGMNALFRILRHWKVPTIVFADGIDSSIQKRFHCETLRFDNEMLDLEMVGRECDLAILNATHGTTASMLLAGKPTLLIPRQLEQHLTAQNVVSLGAGLAAHPRKPRQIGDRLRSLLTQTQYKEAAQKVSSRYRHLNRVDQLDRLIGCVQSFLA